MKSKTYLSSVIVFCLIPFLTSCYSTKVILDENLVIGNDEKLVSYTTKDGTIVHNPPAGWRCDSVSYTKDTLTLKLSPTHSATKERYAIDQKIPISEIYSISTRIPTDSRTYLTINYGFCSGYLTTGSSYGIGLTFMQKNLGGSFRIKGIWSEATDLPSDYTGFFPNDKIYMGCGLLTYKSDITEKVRLGVEMGVSRLAFSKEIEEINPEYDPNSLFHLNKYFRSVSIDKATGLHLRGELGFPFFDHFGIELAIWTNINGFKSLSGVELSIALGQVKR
jgi:hypothetical protein